MYKKAKVNKLMIRVLLKKMKIKSNHLSNKLKIKKQNRVKMEMVLLKAILIGKITIQVKYKLPVSRNVLTNFAILRKFIKK